MSEPYIYGVHAVAALLANPARSVKKLFLSSERADKRVQELVTLAESHNVSITRLSANEMNKRFEGLIHQGVVALADKLPEYIEHDIPQLLELAKTPCLILILDGVTDPHNLGACLRSADGAGVDFVIIPKDKNASITPVVSKVASGAAEFVPLVRVTNLARTIEKLKEQGVWVYGASGDASDTIYNLDYKGAVAIVMGAEGQGMRRLTSELCDGLFSIPMLGSVSSLNVSVATGICLYEAVRQRRA